MGPILKTDRLTLRPYLDADATDVARLLSDLDVSRWLTLVPHPYTVDDARAFFAKTADQPHVYAVCNDGGLVGCVSIRSELGYWYGARFWGRGYATEAARAVLQAHFDRSDETIQSGYHLGNAGSCNVLAKLGFEPTDTRTAYSHAQKIDVTIQGMALSKARWSALQ